MEKERCCGNCRYCRPPLMEFSRTWTCECEYSENLGSEIEYGDFCKEWEEIFYY